MKLYIATLFFLHGLSPLPVIAFGFMIAACAMLFAINERRRWIKGFRFRLDDHLFAAIYALGLLPVLLRSNPIGLQNFIYCALWLSTWIVSFWWVREWLMDSALEFRDISAAAAFGCIGLSIAIISEFVLANTTGLYLSDFFYFSINEFPQATVFGEAFLRPRGFASEAGFTAIAFECLIPLSLEWMLYRRARLWLFMALVAPAYLLLFSAASISFLAVTLLIYTAYRKGAWRALVLGIVALGLVSLAALSSSDFSFVIYEIVIRKYLEFSPSDLVADAASFSRPEAYGLALEVLRERPFGIGWGGISQFFANGQPLFGVDLKGSGLISVPLEIGACAGVTGLVLYVLIVFRKLRRLARLRSLPARLTFISLLWVVLHHAVVLEFWFPMIWFSMALADVIAETSTNRRRSQPIQPALVSATSMGTVR